VIGTFGLAADGELARAGKGGERQQMTSSTPVAGAPERGCFQAASALFDAHHSLLVMALADSDFAY
jgi:hypothetical protein